MDLQAVDNHHSVAFVRGRVDRFEDVGQVLERPTAVGRGVERVELVEDFLRAREAHVAEDLCDVGERVEILVRLHGSQGGDTAAQRLGPVGDGHDPGRIDGGDVAGVKEALVVEDVAAFGLEVLTDNEHAPR